MLEWNYTERAQHYDKRADYSDAAVTTLLNRIHAKPGMPVADIGAGTGKLTKLLIHHGLIVSAVEPNDAMMSFGVQNTQGPSVNWRKGTGESTNLPDASFHAAFFGSSFNVIDQQAGLKEVARILKPNGYFACMWNHRDLTNPLQSEIEGIIRAEVSSYGYGSRREDPTPVVEQSKLFGQVEFLEDTFTAQIPAAAFFEGWKSHATLARQAGDKFATILTKIEKLLQPLEQVDVPYTTRIWFAQLLTNH